jgi:transcriptional regulator with XRE-family HTH domain
MFIASSVIFPPRRYSASTFLVVLRNLLITLDLGLPREKKFLYDPRVIKTSDFAKTLTRLRGSRTKAQCAREAGISANAWTHYEKGRRMPTEASRVRLAKGLGVTLAKLEEELLVSRNQRLQGEEAPAQPEERDDQYQRDVREGLGNISRELERLFLLMASKRGR